MLFEKLQTETKQMSRNHKQLSVMLHKKRSKVDMNGITLDIDERDS